MLSGCVPKHYNMREERDAYTRTGPPIEGGCKPTRGHRDRDSHQTSDQLRSMVEHVVCELLTSGRAQRCVEEVLAAPLYSSPMAPPL